MDIPPPPDEEELLARMEAILRRLPRLTREVYVTKTQDRLTYAEIARRTGLTEAQVRRRMARALLRLVRVLEPEPRPWWKFW